MTKYPLIEAMGLKVLYNYDSNDSDNDFYYVHASSLEDALQAAPFIYSGNPPDSWVALKNNCTIEPLTLDGHEVFEARVVCIQPIKKQTKAEAALDLLKEIIDLNEPKTLIVESIRQEAKKILKMPE